MQTQDPPWHRMPEANVHLPRLPPPLAPRQIKRSVDNDFRKNRRMLTETTVLFDSPQNPTIAHEGFVDRGINEGPASGVADASRENRWRPRFGDGPSGLLGAPYHGRRQSSSTVQKMAGKTPDPERNLQPNRSSQHAPGWWELPSAATPSKLDDQDRASPVPAAKLLRSPRGW